ncbi:putative isoflavone reductase like protein P3 [Tuber magnatum]|uniref:Putative isoflavone reductase like protein P3 n=1 Tax=Tuber magnatum TaxID=42249 RepID=A0A317SU42_9PEZI|nr:putative isoflavone reductase like protein P3 [Tuber magnatum]
MSVIRRVILVGATGNLGPSILKALQASSALETTILTRETSKTAQSPPPNTKVLTADYTSVPSLAAAFAGQDAVVSAIAGAALADQQALIDAAVQAGVKRFIPSEFGSNVTNEKSAKLSVFGGKLATVDYLKKKEGEITWSALINGPFFDWGLKAGFLGIDISNKKASLLDGGDTPFSTTNLSDIGQSVVGILAHPEETKNRYVFVQSALATQNKLLAAAEKATGEKFAIEQRITEDLEREGNEKIAKGDFSGIVDLLKRGVWAEGWGGDYSDKLDNAILGVKVLDDAGVEAVVKGVVG